MNQTTNLFYPAEWLGSFPTVEAALVAGTGRKPNDLRYYLLHEWPANASVTRPFQPRKGDQPVVAAKDSRGWSLWSVYPEHAGTEERALSIIAEVWKDGQEAGEPRGTWALFEAAPPVRVIDP
jgi:hypothetical protein